MFYFDPKRRKKKVKSNRMPAEIKCLLDEFKEIVIDNLQKGFPPMRILSHQDSYIKLSKQGTS